MPTLALERMSIGPKIYPGIDLQWKVIDEDQGIIRGYLAVFNNIDSQKDRIRPNAFKKTIAESLQRKANKGKKFLFPLLWMHEPDKPIGGFIDAEEDKVGLLVTAQLDISTNDQGIPLNPLAMSVFSGFKMGYVDELSIGYKALQKSYDNEGIRDLTEIQLFEGSAVTMLFASNPDAQVTYVKSIYNENKEQIGYVDTDEEGNDRFVLFESKSASGSTSFPLADATTPWDKGQALKDIQEATGNDWSKAGKYFFWVAKSPPEKEGDCKLPFVAKVDGSMKAVPRAIYACAAAIQGARGGVSIPDADVSGVKSKIASYYKKLDAKPPWEDNDKSNNMLNEHKDFNSHYDDAMAQDVLEDWYDLVCSLKYASMDLFTIGDQPLEDAKSALEQFGTAYLAWIQRGIDAKLSDYLAAQMQSQQTQSNGYYYASRNDMPDFKHYLEQIQNERLGIKKGAAISKATSERIGGHIDTLNQMADQHKAMIDQHKSMIKDHQLAMKAINNVADDLSAVIGETAYDDQGADEDEEADAARNGKSRREPRANNAALTTKQQPDNTTVELARLEAWLEAKTSK